jgi:deoxyribonuclease-4
MKIGAHLSVAGGFYKAFERAEAIGANCLQIFSSSPRDWGKPNVAKEQVGRFLEAKKRTGIAPIFFHATYLINLADQGETGKKSKELLISELNLAAEMGVTGSVVHLGSFKDKEGVVDRYTRANEVYKFFIESIQEVLAKTPENTFLIGENAGNRKIGKDLEELATIVQDVSDPRFKICLDTCHLHAAGFDLSTRDRLKEFLESFDQKIGISRLALVHLNDSKDELGSFRDRHENLGKGKVGRETLKELLSEPRLSKIPFILEVPGISGEGPDLENIAFAKGLLE